MDDVEAFITKDKPTADDAEHVAKHLDRNIEDAVKRVRQVREEFAEAATSVQK